MLFRCSSWLFILTLATVVFVALGGGESKRGVDRKEVDLPPQTETCTEEGTCDSVQEDSCVDDHPKCSAWSSKGECDANPKYMLQFCKKSCGICGMNAGNFTEEIDMGVPQILDTKQAVEIKARIEAARDYLTNVVAQDPKLRPLLGHCKLEHKDCAFWATLGECKNNPGYMKVKCAPVCQSCDQILIENRCPIDPETMHDIWKPGDVNEFFTNLTKQEKFQKYEPRVLSRPDYLPGDTEESADYMVNAPWAVVFENFLSDEEAERLIELGMEEGYERSSDVGEIKYDGSHEQNVNSGRTSFNSWCSGVCFNDTLVKGVIDRIAEVTNIPEENSEFLQLLRYREGEYYHSHHDLIEHQIDRQEGVRILTVYMYLNTLEEDAGGGTQFTKLGGLTVQPKRGRALIWPSVLDEDPHKKDPRTMHQALPVKKGVKYGANAWIHQRDFKTAHKNGCT